MDPFVKTGRIFFGICLSALGIQQLFYNNINAVFLPADSSLWLPGNSLLFYVWGALFIVAGLAIILEMKGRMVSLIMGSIFLVLFLFCQVPHLSFINPYGNILGAWTTALKELAFAGGAFCVAGTFPRENSDGLPTPTMLERIIPMGPIFFSIVMIIFGYDHFYYVDFVAPLVPNWIPGHVFWTYFAGVALIGAGVGIITKIKLKLVALLLATMIFLWFVFLHIPRAIADFYGNNGNELTSVFQALGFSGIALVIADGALPSRE